MAKKTSLLVITALMAALTCIATMVITIPSPMNGYIHLGDGLVLLSGILLGPIYGGMAAGVGSMLSDLLLGYPHYALPTLVIKAFAAIVGGIIYNMLVHKSFCKKYHLIPLIAAGIGGGIIVTGGYFIVASILFGEGVAALSSVPGNLLQNLFGIIVSCILMPVLTHVPAVKSMLAREA
ncbi:ECF transporter S component [Velocimicrobium porci]|uniref:ECF transporter S component n=1 Tax=Velocimicrobium porci TaxID=2606634 RepID=A0A6L5XVP6_9FIRM|nr:ECF transporter S component [Velocimicrobium porci]MSS62679.1 ECF transporter S component [Velocimicrobium porci]